MRRREFILGGVATAWSVTARAQQGERMRRVGVILSRDTRRCGIPDLDGGFPAGARAIGLKRWQQCGHPHALGHGQCCQNSLTRGGVSRASARRNRNGWRIDNGPDAGGNPLCADRFRNCCRPDRCRFYRQPGAAWRQCDALSPVRIQPGREMAGIAQADRTERYAGGSVGDATTPSGTGQFGAIQAVAPSLKVEVLPVNMRDARDLERSIATFARSPNGGLILTGSGL
jgi:hypothetical protein